MRKRLTACVAVAVCLLGAPAFAHFGMLASSEPDEFDAVSDRGPLKRILMIAYLVGAALVGLGWLLSLSNPKLQELMFVALVRVAVAPMLISVMVLAVLESSALAQAGNGEVPDGVVKRMPRPADLVARSPADPPAAGGA